MKNKYLLLTLLFSTTLIACNSNNPGENSQQSSSIEEVPPSISNSESEFVSLSQTDDVSSSEDTTEYTTFIEGLNEVFIESGEKYNIKSLLIGIDVDELKVTTRNNNIALWSKQKTSIVGVETGIVDLVFSYNDQYQKVKVNVMETGTYSTNFEFNKFRLEGKNIVAFGDSVTATATLNGTGTTYVQNFANKYGMTLVNNYAIGGTTATYMYPGSNIWKEYASNKTAIDGCRVVYDAAINGEIDDIDYAFIAYGHNDQYFQPDITVPGDDEYCINNTFATCHSYKGSYRYMINVLREMNPYIRIILLNCTYSEYDKNLTSPYGNKYNYTDYRNATKEIAEEMNCRYIDPWDYMKDYFDFGNGNKYYSDSVHLSALGHKILSEYLYTC